MSVAIIIALILSGLLVGFINTLAGGGTFISLSLLMFLGLPANIANGTNRIAVVVQNLVAVGTFRKQKVLDTKKGIIIGIPATIGSILGAYIAVELDHKIIEKAFAVVMIFMLFFIFYKPEMWLKGKESLLNRKLNWKTIVLFFIIGIYGGFIHAGVGYFLIVALVLSIGYDLVRANAVKNLIVLLYAPFTLIIFILKDSVNYKYGLILAVGNMIGAYIASRFAVNWGTNFVRWVIAVIIIITCAHLFGIIDFSIIFKSII